MIKFKIILILISFVLISCQKIEVLEPIVFDFNQLPTITINSEKKSVINLYDVKFDNPYIDHSLEEPPIIFLEKWFANNLNIFGTENQFVINIIDASLKKTEISNTEKKRYQEKTIFFYEISFLVEFILYDDSNFLLANTIVESNRTTTSGKYISLHESSIIIDTLILDCLKDFSIKTEQLTKTHMGKYIL